MNLNTEEKRQAWQRGRQAYIAEMEAYPEFKILQALVEQPDASTEDAVRQVLDLTAAAAVSPEPKRSLGLHHWHTFTSLIQIARRNAPARHAKLVECIARLQKVSVTDPHTGEPLKHDNSLVWTQLPTLGYTAADEWNAFDVADPNTTPEERQGYERFIALLAQLSAAADIDYNDPVIPEMDFSFWSLRAFKEASAQAGGQKTPTDVAVRTACMWALYAADRLWANVQHGRVFGKRGDDPGTRITREMWDGWQQGLLDAQATCADGETKQLVSDAVAQMRKASAET